MSELYVVKHATFLSIYFTPTFSLGRKWNVTLNKQKKGVNLRGVKEMGGKVLATKNCSSFLLCIFGNT